MGFNREAFFKQVRAVDGAAIPEIGRELEFKRNLTAMQGEIGKEEVLFLDTPFGVLHIATAREMKDLKRAVGRRNANVTAFAVPISRALVHAPRVAEQMRAKAAAEAEAAAKNRRKKIFI